MNKIEVKQVNDYVCLLQENNTYEIVKYVGKDLDVCVPNKINGIVVTKIGTEAFYGSKIKSINVPSSVAYVGDYAFSRCYDLEKVYLAEGVKSIGFAITDYDANLKEVSLPNSLEHIEDVLMIGGKDLKYTIYDGAKYLGNEENPYLLFCKVVDRYATKNCEVHDGCKFLSDSSFFACSNLEKVIIPASIKEIGEYAFSSRNNVIVELSNTYTFEFCKGHNIKCEYNPK